MGEDGAKLVVFDLANIGRFSAQMRDARNGVRRRPARNFLGRANKAIQLDPAVAVGELHDALGDAVGT